MDKQKQELKLLNMNYLCSKSIKKDCDRTERFQTAKNKFFTENSDLLTRLANK